jgi:hypothetical protein
MYENDFRNSDLGHKDPTAFRQEVLSYDPRTPIILQYCSIEFCLSLNGTKRKEGSFPRVPIYPILCGSYLFDIEAMIRSPLEQSKYR